MKWILGIVVALVCMCTFSEYSKLDAQDKSGWKSENHQYQVPIGERDGFTTTRTYQRTYYVTQPTGFAFQASSPTQQVNSLVQRSRTVSICNCGCKKVGCTCGSVIGVHSHRAKIVTRIVSSSRNAESPYSSNETYNQTVAPTQ